MNKFYQETYCQNLDEFLAIGKSHGELIPSRKNGRILDILTPTRIGESKKKSLSQKYGLEEFPLHSDCAYYVKPPRFILLRYVGELKKVTPTVLVRIIKEKLSVEEIDFLNRAIWLVKGIKGNFYSSIFQNGFIRYDPEIMTLVSCRENLMRAILQKIEIKNINWTKNKVVIINNWTCLHYRPKVKEIEYGNRILQRINIK